MKLTLDSIFPHLINIFFAGTDSHLSASWELDQHSDVAQACDGRNEQVCLIKSMILPQGILMN